MNETGVRPWRTCDLKVVAVLTLLGFPMLKYGKEGGRAFFDFEESDKRRDAVLSFWNKKLQVEPMAFLDSLSRARDLVTLALNS